MRKFSHGFCSRKPSQKHTFPNRRGGQEYFPRHFWVVKHALRGAGFYPAVRTLLAARRNAEKRMRQRTRGVVEKLNRVIGPVDGRWDSFGLNQPGIKQAPPRPENVTVELIGNNAAIKWDKTPRAERFRVWVKIVGVDEEAKPIGRPSDNDFTMEDLPSNPRLEVSVSAANNGGESARSEAVIFPTNNPSETRLT